MAGTVDAGAPPQHARKWWTGEIVRLEHAQDAEPASLVTSAHVAEAVVHARLVLEHAQA